VAFEFIADRPVLDFLATLAERGTSDEEQLRTPGDLAAWAVQSGLTTAPGEVDAEGLASAVALREAAYRLLSGALDGEAPRAEDRRLVNAAAARPGPTLQLSAAGEVSRTGDLGAVLAALAADCLDLLGGPDRDRLARCADARCTRLFVDRSRGRRRRWCDMKGCGDRAKAAAYRRRRRVAGGMA
jgi:predicted RNA-binding Zn ribbon-like protein